MVQENASLVSMEHQLLDELYKTGMTEQALDDYMLELERILDHRESMIEKFRASVTKYREAENQTTT